MKLSRYVRSGKGRGLLYVFLMTLLLAALYGGVIYYAGLQLIKLPPFEEFLESVPTFKIENGVVTDNTIRWRSQIPLTPIPVVIDTTHEELVPPLANGVYMTSKYMYNVAGTEISRSPIPQTMDVNYDELKKLLQIYVTSFAVGTAVVFFMFSLVFYAIIVLLSTLGGLIFRLHLGEGRVWRASAIAWTFGQLLNFVAGITLAGNAKWGAIVSLIIFIGCVSTTLGLLKRSQD